MTRARWASAVVVGSRCCSAGPGPRGPAPARRAASPPTAPFSRRGRRRSSWSSPGGRWPPTRRGRAGRRRRSLAVGEPRPSGDRSLVQTVRSAERGDVVVAYHVVLADGSEKSGTLWFSVGTGVRPAGVPDQGAEAAAPLHEHGIDPLSAVLLLINAVVVFVAVAMLVLRPRRASSRRPPRLSTRR
ncbi:hypothetical protein V2I01_42720 [Micromonospora sp. BRA006-A]|nr:hypothetical protein [Micromonospora sp. BRA006-A]